MLNKTYYVYILASFKNGTLYTGFTSNLLKRIGEHKEGLIEGFTREYRVDNLVYFEEFGEVSQALHWENQLKRWRREWKIALIEKDNPGWRDLFNDLLG